METIALRSDLSNPALDAGDDSLVTGTTDARGFERFFDIPGVANNGANTVDLGAFETQQVPSDVNIIEATPARETHLGTDATDVFIFEPGDSTLAAQDGILDFDAGDLIDVSAFDFTGIKDTSFWDPDQLTVKDLGTKVAMWSGRAPDGFNLLVKGSFEDVMDGLILDMPEDIFM